MIEETYRIKAIVLKRQPFREHDLSIVVYSPEKGKQILVARGARKFRSKVAAHVEPFCFVDCLVVRGKTYDYLGSAISENCLAGLKADVEKIIAAARVVNFFDQQIKIGSPDEEMFFLLRDFLHLLSKSSEAINYEFIADLFLGRLLAHLGVAPELYKCVFCGQDLSPGGNSLDLRRGGVVCGKCRSDAQGLTISDEAVMVLRLAFKLDVAKYKNFKISQSLAEEISHLLQKITEQHH